LDIFVSAPVKKVQKIRKFAGQAWRFLAKLVSAAFTVIRYNFKPVSISYMRDAFQQGIGTESRKTSNMTT